MFSSLDLRASDDLVASLERLDPNGDVRRAVGIDTVVTFGRACPGREIARVEEEDASICRDDAALRPPYWVLLGAAATSRSEDASPIAPADASLDAHAVLASAREAVSVSRSPTSLEATIDAPADGWIWMDRAWWPAWQTSVDGRPVTALRALGGQLVPVSAGRHRLVSELVPWDALVGLAAGIIALGAALLWVSRRRLAFFRGGAAGRSADSG
jgi:hypothetical protein